MSEASTSRSRAGNVWAEFRLPLVTNATRLRIALRRSAASSCSRTASSNVSRPWTGRCRRTAEAHGGNASGRRVRGLDRRVARLGSRRLRFADRNTRRALRRVRNVDALGRRPDPASIRTITQVMLSSPPCSLAIAIELPAGVGQIRRRFRPRRQDLVVGDHAAQAVRAEHVEVAELGVVALQIDRHVILHAERARDHVLRQLAALLFGELGHREQVVVDQRVIARQQLDLRPRARGTPGCRRRGR